MAQLLQWRRQHRQAKQDVADKRFLLRARADVLERMRQTWIKDVLAWPEGIPRGQIDVLRMDHRPRALPADATVSRIFDDADGGLLILGPQGSGRTTTLRELARDLLDRADRDAEQPMPLVLNLSSWAQQRLPLADWLVDELHHSYDVPRWMAQEWVDADAILPLLDGLDEVAAPSSTDDCATACVWAINEFQFQRMHSVKLIVCSRTEEHQTLATRLALKDAVVLNLPTCRQDEDYLDAMGAPLAGVRVALNADPTLRKLVQSPLMLSLVTLAYEGKAAGALAASGPLEERLLAAYIERMFKRRPLVARYNEERAINWLARLARSMRHHSHSELDLDRLQPEWLSSMAQQRRAQQRLVRLVPAVLSGLLGGLLVGLIVGLGGGLSVGPSVRSASGLVNGLASGLILLLVALGGGRFHQPVGTTRWLWSAVRVIVGLGIALGVTWVFGLSGVLVAVLAALVGKWVYEFLRRGGAGGAQVTIEPVERGYRSGSRPGLGLSFRIVGLVVGLVALRVAAEMLTNLGAAVGVLAGAVLLSELLSELVPRVVDVLADKGATPNEGIHRSARKSLTMGLVFGLTLWLAVAGAFVLAFEQQVGLRGAVLSGLAFGLSPGLVFGLVFGLHFGGIACLRHLVLRGFLVCNGDAPWRYVRFLDEAADRRFLRKSGGSYIFVHRLMLEHFARL